MAEIASLIHEISTSTGTGDMTLLAVNARRTFNDGFGTGGTNLFFYAILNRDEDEWEYGTGHLSSSTVLVRDTVIKSSNSDSAVNFSAGTKDVINDLPAEEQIFHPLLFADNTGLYDANGNEVLILQTATSAVNYWDMANAATGNWPLLMTNGPDADVPLHLKIKTTPTAIGSYPYQAIMRFDLGDSYYPMFELYSAPDSAHWIGQGNGITFTAYMDMATPEAGIWPFSFEAVANNDNDERVSFASQWAQVVDITEDAEIGSWHWYVRGSGSMPEAMILRGGAAGGLILGAPTGSFKGASTINVAGGMYVNNSAVLTAASLDADLTSWAAITRASGFDTFVATPSGANLASLLTTALPVSKGGTGQTTEAEALGEMTQALTEDTAPVGSADYVMTYDASADTGKKVLLRNATARVKLGEQVASSSATIDFALEDFPGYTRYIIKITDMQVATDGAALLVRVATDAAAPYTYHTTSYFPITAYLFPDTTVLYNFWDSGSDGAEVTITDNIEAVATYGGMNGEVEIYPMAADVDMAYFRTTYSENTLALLSTMWGSFYYDSTTNWTAIRFILDSGNIESGKFTLYGEV